MSKTLLIPGIVPIICLIVLNTKIYHYITGLKSALQCKEGRIEKEIYHRNKDKLAPMLTTLDNYRQILTTLDNS